MLKKKSLLCRCNLVGVILLALCGLPSAAIAKSIQLRLIPSVSQSTAMAQGRTLVVSEQSSTNVQLIAPRPTDDNRIQIDFVFVNRSNTPLNIGPENVSSTPINLLTHEFLAAEQRRREGWARFAAAMQVMSNSANAGNAGSSYGTYHYNGMISGGIGQNYNYSGSGTVKVYDPNAAAQAQATANAQNIAIGRQFQREAATGREKVDQNLQTTTIFPGQAMPGMLTFEIPKSVRRSKTLLPFSISVFFGGNSHIFTGYVGRVDAEMPPNQATITQQPQNLSFSQNFSDPNAGLFKSQPDNLRALADRGDATAQYNLATMYSRGSGVPQDWSAAAGWFQRAALQGKAEAQFSLASLHEGGLGVGQDWGLANSWHKKAADQGYRPAQSRLGHNLALGYGIPANHAEAFRLLDLVGMENNADGLYALGQLYLHGLGVSQNQTEGMKFLTISGERGNSNAYYAIALKYELGEGVPKDIEKALHFYNLSAKNGNEEAASVARLINTVITSGRMVIQNSNYPRNAIPVRNAGSWITSDDYPFEQLSLNISGNTKVFLRISKAGHVLSCHVIQSSGASKLDQRACGILSSRGIFTPAQDANGTFKEDYYTTTVRWSLNSKR